MVIRSVPAALLAPAAAFAAAHDVGGGVDLTAGVRMALAYDDNALLGRRGQFLDSPGAGVARKADGASLQAIDVALGRRAGRGGRLGATGRFELARLRTAEELAGYDAASAIEYDAEAGARTPLHAAVRLALHREQPEWSWRAVEPSARAEHTFDAGWRLSATWRFTATDFARHGDGSAQPRNSYANVDQRAQQVELDARTWPTRRVRVDLFADARAARFSGNTSASLADYAGLERGVERADRGAGATGSLLLEPWRTVLLGAGARVEAQRSNAAAFTWNAAHALGSVLVTFRRRHAVYAQVDLGRYDLYEMRFDRRYADTRRDWRRDVAAMYRFDVTERLSVEVAFRRIEAVSNDCADFDPERDAAGLPVFSRSYSCFSRNRVEAAARWEL